jgi:hypothetical protein
VLRSQVGDGPVAGVFQNDGFQGVDHRALIKEAMPMERWSVTGRVGRRPSGRLSLIATISRNLPLTRSESKSNYSA